MLHQLSTDVETQAVDTEEAPEDPPQAIVDIAARLLNLMPPY
jgi:hypothetical protein